MAEEMELPGEPADKPRLAVVLFDTESSQHFIVESGANPRAVDEASAHDYLLQLRLRARDPESVVCGCELIARSGSIDNGTDVAAVGDRTDWRKLWLDHTHCGGGGKYIERL